jgi:hypothetical protein
MEPGWGGVIVAAVGVSVAIVVAIFTISNVLTARRAYVESTFDRKVSQARLVWAELAGHVGKAKGARAGDMAERTLRDLLGSGTSWLGDSNDDYEPRVEDGETYSVIARDLTIFGVRITNNSDEPIGRCSILLEGSKRLEVAPPGRRSWEHRAGRLVARVLPPRTTKSVRIVVPLSYADLTPRSTRVVVGFTDSAGHRWMRTDTKTPTLVPKPRPPRFQKLRAWRLRTVRRIKTRVSRIRKAEQTQHGTRQTRED